MLEGVATLHSKHDKNLQMVFVIHPQAVAPVAAPHAIIFLSSVLAQVQLAPTVK